MVFHTATIGCLQGRVAADMGCTPSIHVSHTGVVYCRDNEEAATSSPQGTLSASGTASATTATAVHVSTRGGPGRSSGRGHKDKQLAVMSSTAAAVTTSSHGGHGDPALATGSVDSAADVGCRRGDGGRLSVTLSEAETQTSRQSMKVIHLSFFFFFLGGVSNQCPPNVLRSILSQFFLLLFFPTLFQ